MINQQPVNRILGIAEIAENHGFGWTNFHTGRLYSGLNPMKTPMTLLHRVVNRMQMPHSIRAGGHAVATADTDVGIDNHNSIIPFGGCLHGTDRHAGRMIAVIAQQRQKMPPYMRVGALLDFFDPRSPDTEGNIVFTLTGNGAGATTDAPAKIDDNGIATPPGPTAHAAGSFRFRFEPVIFRRETMAMKPKTPQRISP
jgi:hypothetical protein